MSSKRTGDQPRSPSPLLVAAQAFADEMTSYAHLSESFVRAPLGSAKQIERVNDLLEQIANSEQRLAERGQGLAQAVSVARDQQEKLAAATIDRVSVLKARMDELRVLVSAFEALGQEAAGLNQTAVALRPLGDETGVNQTERARGLASDMQGLAMRAEELAVKARAAQFEDLSDRAHALHQQLLAAHHKFRLAILS